MDKLRFYLATVAALMVVLLLSACQPIAPESMTQAIEVEAQQGDDSLTFVSWGGVYQEGQTEAWIKPYMEETGLQIDQDGPTDYAKIIEMVEAGEVTWDVVDIENDFGIGDSAQYFEPIDYSIVPRDQILPGLANEHRVGVMLYATVLGYNTETYSDVPRGWADFFDVENFPGIRSLPHLPSRYILEVALIADGVDPADLYPLDIERALTKLDTIKEHAIFWETGAEAADQLASGAADMGMIWNGRLKAVIDEGAPLAMQWNQHVALADYLAVPKGSPHKEAAMELIAYMLSAENNHRLAEYVPAAPVNIETFDQVNAEMASHLPSFGDRPSLGFQPSDEWWSENREESVEMYNRWLSE